MAGTSLFALLDDIASILDDVSILTKVAARKTAGVLGDDLALNAEQVSGVNADRELPVVWAVAKGSAKNKCILVPAAIVISATIPWAITPLLMLGGAYLCFEGVEKIAEAFHEPPEEKQSRHLHQVEANRSADVDMVEFEKDKIKGAIRTDFVLSAEIIVIALGTVQAMPLVTQIGVLVAIAALMTVGVYGLVAGIVKLDDAGLYLSQASGEGMWPAFKRRIGAGVLVFAPYLMKSLSVVGTAAMFLVGGGILAHGLPFAEPAIHYIKDLAHSIPAVGGVMSGLAGLLANAGLGIVCGALLLGVVHVVGPLVKRKEA